MKRADIKIGFACNNHCRFCVQGRKRENLRAKSADEVKKEIARASNDCQEIVFTGGEPTIHPDFLDLVKYAKAKGFQKIQIQTNGRMFAYLDFCRQTIAAGANEFSPALHGHIAQLHDFLTSVPGSFDQTVQGIKNLKSLGQAIITNTVITKSNYRHLPEIARLLVNLGVDQYQFAFVHALGNAADNFESVVPRMVLTEPFVKKGLDIGIKAGKKVMTEAIPYCFMRGYEEYIAEKIIPATKIFDFGKVDEDFTSTRQKEGKKKGVDCKKCDFYKVCEGPWREYPEKFGWSEFKPRTLTREKGGGDDFISKIDNIFESLIKENGLSRRKKTIKKILEIIFSGFKDLNEGPKIEFSFSFAEKKAQSGLSFFAHPHYLWQEYAFKDNIRNIFYLFKNIYATEQMEKVLTLSYLAEGKLVSTFGLDWINGQKYPRLKIFFERPTAGKSLLPGAQIKKICGLLGVKQNDLGDSSRQISVFGIDFFPGKRIGKKIYSQKSQLEIEKALLEEVGKKSPNSRNFLTDILSSKKGATFVHLQRLSGNKNPAADKIYKIYDYAHTSHRKNLLAAEEEIKNFLRHSKSRELWQKISRWKSFCQNNKLRACPVSVAFDGKQIWAYYYCQFAK